MEQLITDRTKLDAEYAFLNQHLPNLKGAYNASDLNRVGAWINHLGIMLNGRTLNARTDWKDEETPRESDWQKYIDKIRELRRITVQLRDTPTVPENIRELLEDNGWERANDIEKNLRDIEIMLIKRNAAFRYLGTFHLGEDNFR